MLNFPDSLTILSLLSLFVPSVDRRGVCRTVRGCVWVEYPYIKKCILRHVPETSCTNVYTSSIFSVCRASCHSLSTKGLEWRLCCDVADFSQECSCYVTNLIVADGWEASHVAYHGVIDSELCATVAGQRGVDRLPSISQT